HHCVCRCAAHPDLHAFPTRTLFRSVQVGAFRNPRGAQDLAARLRSAGFEPRIITVEGNTLLRVRVGYFPDGNAARAHARRLRERSEEHTSELQSRENLVCRLLLEKK